MLETEARSVAKETVTKFVKARISTAEIGLLRLMVVGGHASVSKDVVTIDGTKHTNPAWANALEKKLREHGYVAGDDKGTYWLLEAGTNSAFAQQPSWLFWLVLTVAVLTISVSTTLFVPQMIKSPPAANSDPALGELVKSLSARIELLTTQLDSLAADTKLSRQKERLNEYYNKVEADIRLGFSYWIEAQIERLIAQSILNVLDHEIAQSIESGGASAQLRRDVAKAIFDKRAALGDSLKREFNTVLAAEVAMVGNFPSFARDAFREWLDRDTDKSKLVEDAIADVLANAALADTVIAFIRKKQEPVEWQVRREQLIGLITSALRYGLVRGRFEIDSIWLEQSQRG